MHRPLFLLLLICLASCASSQVLDDAILAEVKRQGIPGASVAVVRDGAIVHEAGYGLANIELDVHATPATVYQTGSIGKQFTAALVMLLVTDGRIALDDPVAKHLPGTPPSWAKITLRQLLTHTSGLADPYEKLDLTRDYTDEELLAIDGAVPLLFEPGTAWSYSNMGYHVLGFLCTRVGGKFYGDQLVERLFRPAGMTTARVIDEHDLVHGRADGYELRDDVLKNQSWVAPRLNKTADGSIYLTAHDFAQWDRALDAEVPLSRAVQAEMGRPCTLADGKEIPYGFGWGLAPYEEREAIAHGGAWQGFTTYYLRLVEERLSVVVLTNRAGADPAAIVKIIVDYYLSRRGR